jgi:hypothetical protein
MKKVRISIRTRRKYLPKKNLKLNIEASVKFNNFLVEKVISLSRKVLRFVIGIV